MAAARKGGLVFWIAGFAPAINWKRNVKRQHRTIPDAREIAGRFGVHIPEDYEFLEDDTGDLIGTIDDLVGGGKMQTARCSGVSVHPDGFIYWRDHYHPRTRMIPIRVNPDVLTSDEAIVAVFAHEVFELQRIYEVCSFSRRLRMSGRDYGIQVAEDIPHNFHFQAWDLADALVRRMRS